MRACRLTSVCACVYACVCRYMWEVWVKPIGTRVASLGFLTLSVSVLIAEMGLFGGKGAKHAAFFLEGA